MFYTIDNDKLEQVVKLFNEQVDPKATEDVIKAEICGDWHEGEEHQEWINSATPQQIVEWLATFYE